MKPQKINYIIYVIIGILIFCFLALWYISLSNPYFGFITYLSGISSFFVAILTALNVYTTTHQIEVAKMQLSEMQSERALQQQPLVIPEDVTFLLERPRFFYTPPLKEYSFLSRYNLTLNLKNISSFPAVSIDVTARIVLKRENKVYTLTSVSHTCKTLSTNEIFSVQIHFSGDEATWLFDSLREPMAEQLPKIEIRIIYKNLCGGYFRCSNRMLLAPEKCNVLILRNWHSRINSVHYEEKETIRVLKTLQPHSNKWQEVFDQAKNRFDSSLDGGESVEVNCIDIPQDFQLISISEKEYSTVSSNHQFPRYVHQSANCERIINRHTKEENYNRS